jgi:hypothetical protein
VRALPRVTVQRLETTTPWLFRSPLAAVTLGLLVAALPGTAASTRPVTAPIAPQATASGPAPGPTAGALSPSCLATTLCALKNEVRWRTPRWDPATCARVADAVLAASARYDLSPALLLAVMLNESDLDEKAAVPYKRDGAVYAKDGGLMGIRCVFDDGAPGRCGNGQVRGLAFRTLMDPARNVELGARQLAYFRDQGGVERRRVRVRGEDGKLTTVTKLVRCRHRDHAWWAHYNHGNFYIRRGFARHYPHRIAVLYQALAATLGLPAPDLAGRPITMLDPGRRARTADRPVEARFRVLCRKIRTVGLGAGACQAEGTALARVAPGAAVPAPQPPSRRR